MATTKVERIVPHDQFVLQAHQLYSEQTIASKGSINGTVSVTKSGYYPLCIAGWSAGGAYSGFITPGRLYINNQAVGSCDIVYNFQNNADTALTGQGFGVRVLWVRV